MQLLNTDLDRKHELERKNDKIVMPQTDKTAHSNPTSRAPTPDAALETKNVPKLDVGEKENDNKGKTKTTTMIKQNGIKLPFLMVIVLMVQLLQLQHFKFK